MLSKKPLDHQVVLCGEITEPLELARYSTDIYRTYIDNIPVTLFGEMIPDDGLEVGRWVLVRGDLSYLKVKSCFKVVADTLETGVPMEAYSKVCFQCRLVKRPQYNRSEKAYHALVIIQRPLRPSQGIGVVVSKADAEKLRKLNVGAWMQIHGTLEEKHVKVSEIDYGYREALQRAGGHECGK